MFSITTIASSTTIPSASKKEKRVIKFSVKPNDGNIKNAMKADIGTDMATKMALVTHEKHKDDRYQHKTNNDSVDQIM